MRVGDIPVLNEESLAVVVMLVLVPAVSGGLQRVVMRLLAVVDESFEADEPADLVAALVEQSSSVSSRLMRPLPSERMDGEEIEHVAAAEQQRVMLTERCGRPKRS